MCPMHRQCIANASPMHRQCIANASPMHRQCIANEVFFSFFLGVLLVRRMGCGWVAREAWAAGHSDGTWRGAKGWIHSAQKNFHSSVFFIKIYVPKNINLPVQGDKVFVTLPKAWSWEVDSRSCRRKMSSTLLVVVKQARCWSPSSTTALCWCALVSHYCRKKLEEPDSTFAKRVVLHLQHDQWWGQLQWNPLSGKRRGQCVAI